MLGPAFTDHLAMFDETNNFLQVGGNEHNDETPSLKSSLKDLLGFPTDGKHYFDLVDILCPVLLMSRRFA